MSIKSEILDKLCYTELVYRRINKKLRTQLSKTEIEKLLVETIKETPELDIQKKGKNFYISNHQRNIRLTVNSNTFRIITADLMR